MKLLRTLSAVAVLAMGADVARADFVAYSTPTTIIGNQGYAGSVGLDFNVTGAISVTQLGAFDSGANGFAGPVTVSLYNRTTQAIVTTTTFAAGTGGTLVGSDRFVSLGVPVTLAAGAYSIVATYTLNDPIYNANRNGNTAPSTLNSGSGAIAFTGTGRYGFSNTYPTNTDGEIVVNPFAAGTFQYNPVAVPEPTSVALLGLGAAGLVLRARRRKPAAV